MEPLLSQALTLHRQGRLAHAETIYRAILEADPDHFDARHLLGVIRHQQGRHQEAVNLVRAALERNPEVADAHFNLGNALRALGRTEEAILSYRRAVELAPGHAAAHLRLGVVLAAAGRDVEAADSYRRAIAGDPGHADAHHNLGNALRRLGRWAEAIASYRRALEIDPDRAEAHQNLGIVLGEINRREEAAASLLRALQVRPQDPVLLYNLGNALSRLDRLEEAVAIYRQAIALRPDLADAHQNLGNALRDLDRLEDAAACYRRAIETKAGNVPVFNDLAFLKRTMCDWADFEEDARALTDHVRHVRFGVDPWPFLAFSADPQDQLRCARTWTAHRLGVDAAPLPPSPAGHGGRIRLAYVSSDFREHPLARLMVELFERHDRRRFEVIAISHGPDDASPMRRRLERAFDRFVDVRRVSDDEAAGRIAELGADIAIELNGHTRHNRMGILACRPAPVQVAYMGFPGTTGAAFLDYVLVDRFVAPADQQPHFTEKLVHLPDCYWVTDSAMEVADGAPPRADCGLPEQGFVFCCFNNTYKITPAVFDVWMRLLTAVPGSVLWLLRANAAAETNLRREAAARGMDPDRLRFAPRVPAPDHLARHRHADLFLDTLPVGAHTTASDALWVGLPVVTCAGTTLAGRVAGSLLHTIGLPELVTESLEDYEALALELAHDPARRATLRDTLRRNRTTMPLFDTDRFRRALERAFTEMVARRRRGEPPCPFAVEPDAGPAQPGAAGA